MIRRPPRSTRTDPRFPYTTLFRSAADHSEVEVWDRPRILLVATGDEILAPGCATRMPNAIPDSLSLAIEQLCASAGANVVAALRIPDNERALADAQQERSEERRVGKECGRTWRSRWVPSH